MFFFDGIGGAADSYWFEVYNIEYLLSSLQINTFKFGITNFVNQTDKIFFFF